MAEEEVKYTGMEETLFKLLKDGGAGGMEQDNLLVLLSLVNLMGIVNIISHRAGIKGANVYTADSGAEGVRPAEEIRSGGKGPAMDPSALLGMLAGKGGPGMNQSQLTDFLSRFIGPPAGKTFGSAGESPKEKDEGGIIVQPARGKP